ncbi:hypothetical protein [Desulfofundulus sp.]|uniref:hypothetical protein n=1 Tax=Desulfofundulus sp. TaxID=2282750 RepID=UPI003C76CC86
MQTKLAGRENPEKTRMEKHDTLKTSFSIKIAYRISVERNCHVNLLSKTKNNQQHFERK